MTSAHWGNVLDVPFPLSVTCFQPIGYGKRDGWGVTALIKLGYMARVMGCHSFNYVAVDIFINIFILL